MADPKIWKDKDGDVHEIEAGYFIRQPGSTNEEERNQAAQNACAAVAKEIVEGWNGTPGTPFTFKFHSVKLLKREGETTKTKKDPLTGKRHHEVRGTGVAELLYLEQK